MMKFRSLLAMPLIVGASACAVEADDGGAAQEEGGGAQQQAIASAAKTKLKLGALVDQTGVSTSPHFTYAVELAVKQMNQAVDNLVIGGHFEFVPVFGDTKSTPATARTLAIKLINEDQVLGLVSDSSGDSLQASRLNYDTTGTTIRKVPITCFQCSSAFFNDPTYVDADPLSQLGFRDPNDWLFRVFYNAKYEALVMLRIAMQHGVNGDTNGDGAFKIGIYADGGHTSSAVAAVAALPGLYAGTSYSETINFTTAAAIPTDLPKLVDDFNVSTNVTDAYPDTVLVAALPGNVTPVVQQYRAAGYTIPLQSVNAFRRDYILASVGAIAEGLEGSSIAAYDNSPSGAAFYNAFVAAYGAKPEVTASGAYDSMVTLMLATLVAAHDKGGVKKVTPADIRLGLTKINQECGVKIKPTVADFKKAAQLIRLGLPINYEGAFDSIDWDAVGDMFPPLVHWKVEGGQFVEYERYACSPSTPTCPIAP
ncbi:MAG: amino acid ABC transporter substrate-binding protein [Myxococcales bacterium]|nr:MAG: amino acid ABC transporter substrate-binding protein [Myxococcales bacterium]